MDSRGRIFVGNRSNNRRFSCSITNRRFLTQWTQARRPSGITFDSRDRIYVADSGVTTDVQNPGREMGVRIGDAKDG